MLLNKSDILARLRELDLKSEGVSSKVDVLIVGGSALALLGESRLFTERLFSEFGVLKQCKDLLCFVWY